MKNQGTTNRAEEPTEKTRGEIRTAAVCRGGKN